MPRNEYFTAYCEISQRVNYDLRIGYCLKPEVGA